MKVFDCVTFNGEVDHLAARIELLDGLVDAHLVVEGTHTHQGAERETFAHPGLIDATAGHPVSFGLADLSGYADSWARERAQRDFIGPWVTHLAEPDDLVLVSDVDEHINPYVLASAIRATVDGPVSLGMRMLYYGLNWEDVGPNPPLPRWLHPRAMRARHLPASLSALREAPQASILFGAGWHVSYTGLAEDRVRKLAQFAHTECNDDEHRQRVSVGDISGIGPNGEQLSPVTSRDGIPDALTRRFG